MALALILFDGGLRTRFANIRTVLAPSMVLATVGVLLTAVITAAIEQIIRDDPGQWLWIHNRWPTARDAELMRGKA